MTKTWPMKEKVANLDLTKLIFFCFAKFNAKKIKRRATDCKKIFAEAISNKRLLSKG